VVSAVDNVLRPWLLRRVGATVHPMLLFFAILSGIGLFGISGVVFGPLLIAVLVTLAQIYREQVGDAAARPPGAAPAPATAPAAVPPAPPAA
jgi:predicted PurR-regulated permease PerM